MTLAGQMQTSGTVVMFAVILKKKTRGNLEMRKQKGFSLIELLIVVAIILLISA